MQCLYNGDITTITAELISSEIRVMASIYKIMGQWSCHILMNLNQRRGLQVKIITIKVFILIFANWNKHVH